EGGYQTWRRTVAAALHDLETAPALKLVLLDGLTGSGKTEVLARLADYGVQSLDLEGLAAHRGSLFGRTEAEQPSQKLFESRLYAALAALDLSRPVVVEAEASRIGRLTVPPVLWAAMKAAPALRLSAPFEARVERVLRDYQAATEDAAVRDALLARMPSHHSRERIAQWRALSQAGDLRALATALMREHYDPAYRRASAGARDLGEITMDGGAESDLDRAAEAVAVRAAAL
ncbi:MAG: tRNA 2-selenouridine(34) synthase MnmH, partial [Brevundimonas diminuta]|nr:tRNA 2-selenouridine(34) synthase MnmH [Brevundimonas diminuta]